MGCRVDLGLTMNHQNYVLGFAFNMDRTRVVMIKKTRPAWQAGKLNGIGGKIDPGEDPIDAMCREFHEETGVPTQPADWHYFADLKALDANVHCYRLFDDKILAARTVEDQKIVLVETDIDVLRETALASCAWLITIALDNDVALSFVTANYNQKFTMDKKVVG